MVKTVVKSKKRIEIIAEIANSHNGSPEDAIRLAKECFTIDIDAVKFQIYFADELLTTYHSRYEHFKSQSFSEKGSSIDFILYLLIIFLYFLMVSLIDINFFE